MLSEENTSNHDCTKHQFSAIDSLANSVFGAMQCKNCYKLFTLNKVIGLLYICLEMVLMMLIIFYSISEVKIWPPFAALALGCLLRIYAMPHLSHQTEKRKKFRPSKNK
jgi:hypothetical protein